MMAGVFVAVGVGLPDMIHFANELPQRMSTGYLWCIGMAKRVRGFQERRWSGRGSLEQRRNSYPRVSRRRVETWNQKWHLQ